MSLLDALYHPLGQEQLTDPYPLYEQARRQEPVFYTERIVGQGVYVVTRYDDIMTILTRPEIFSSKDALHPLVEWDPQTFEVLSHGYQPSAIHINSDGEAHTRFRAPLAKALSAARMHALVPLIRAHAQSLIDSFIEDHSTDIIARFAYPLPLEVILSLFHLPEEDMQRVKRWCDDWLALVSSPLGAEQQVTCAQSVVAFQHYMARLIETRRNHPQSNDLVSEMIQHVEPGQAVLSEAELIHSLGGVLLAGHETSTNMIGNGLAFLLSHREHWVALCENPGRIPDYLEEVIRYDSPAQTFFRTTTRATRIGGVDVPAEALILVVFGSAHRDEQHFHDANHFSPNRTEKNFVFGFGRHFCVGATLAKIEGKIAFELLTQRLPGLQLEANQDFKHVETLMFRGLAQLFVAW